MFPYNVSAYIIIIETLKFVNALSKIFSFFFTNRQKNLRLFLSSGFSFGCGRLPLPQDILFLNQWSERKTALRADRISDHMGRLTGISMHGMLFGDKSPQARRRGDDHSLSMADIIFKFVVLSLK